MDSYHNSVTDILLVVDFSESTYIQIFNKEHQLKWEHRLVDSTLPEKVVASIFSASFYVSCKGQFTLLPNTVNSTSSYEDLNFGGVAEVKEYEGLEFKVLSNATAEIDLNSLVGIEEKIDIQLIFDELHTSKASDAIFFYEVDGSLTLLVWKKGVFQLANRYTVGTADELFYYIMLSVEQLELDISNLDFSTASCSASFEQYKSSFSEYLPALKNYTYDKDFSTSEETVVSFISRCVL